MNMSNNDRQPETADLHGDLEGVIAWIKTRDTPQYAGRVQWRYNMLVAEIERLRAALQPLAGVVDCVDRPGSMRLSDDTGLWTQGDNANGDYRLTLGHARRAKEIIDG